MWLASLSPSQCNLIDGGIKSKRQQLRVGNRLFPSGSQKCPMAFLTSASRHFLPCETSLRPDSLPQNHISPAADLTGCPSLCAALIYPNSGFPENPQISVKHNQPSTVHRAIGWEAWGAYSLQLHKSHCNLCRVTIGFRRAAWDGNEPS